MKKVKSEIFFIVLILLLIFGRASSYASQIKIERLITDFRGIVTNSISTICYGDYGIINYSMDEGESWGQTNIGDRYSIKRIRSIGNDYYGVTNYSIIKSSDNGLTWINKTITGHTTLLDFVNINNNLIILTPHGLIELDTNLDAQATTIYELDSNEIKSEIETDGYNLYILDDQRKLLIYNLETKKSDLIEILEVINCNNCSKISNLKVFDNKIYIMIGETAEDNYYYSFLYSSSDKGKTWQRLTQQYPNSLCYKIKNNEIIYLLPSFITNSSQRFLSVNYCKVDSSHFEIDSSYISQISVEQKLHKYITYHKEFYFSDFIQINQTIIAVGSDKMIAVSKNNGKSFEFKSYFNGIYSGIDNIKILNDSIIYVINNYEITKTKDGGITWLPQNYNDYLITTISQPVFYNFEQNGIGFLCYRKINNNDSNFLLTSDYGES
jgi:photosystem II stability/assembly factor-like uncharacterized protein